MPEKWRELGQGPADPFSSERPKRPRLVLGFSIPAVFLFSGMRGSLIRALRGEWASDLQEGTWLPRRACHTLSPGKAGPGGVRKDRVGKGSQPSAWQETC